MRPASTLQNIAFAKTHLPSAFSAKGSCSCTRAPLQSRLPQFQNSYRLRAQKLRARVPAAPAAAAPTRVIELDEPTWQRLQSRAAENNLPASVWLSRLLAMIA
jgi:hypothetical protein